MSTLMRWTAGFSLVVVAWACSQAPAPEAEPEHESVVVTQWNDSTELFLEYPHPVAGQATGNWAIHLTDREDFKPIRSGTLTVRFMTGSELRQSFMIDGVLRDGIFILDPVIERPGDYRVELALESPQASSVHVLPSVTVFSTIDEVPLAGEEAAAGAIAFLKEQQWQIPFDVTPVREDSIRRTVAAPAEIVPPDGALVLISAPADGIAPADANRTAPSVGQPVRAGQLLATLAPTTQEGGFVQIRAQVERLERNVSRDERLFAAGAIPARRLEEARHDLEVARAQAAAIGAGEGDDFRLRLTSPITGVVARRTFVPGGRVQAGDPLFTIVDPRSAWLRVHVPASVAASIPTGARATFTIAGSETVQQTGRLVSIGSVLDAQTRTVPAVFELGGDGGRFTFGQLAQAAVPVGGIVAGIVIPNAAIIDDNGTSVAYVQAGGETFERRVLTLGETDGMRTHVITGLRSGEMVVTIGGYQVRLASMSGNEFAGGHAH